MKKRTIKSKIKIAFPIILGLLFLSYGNKTSHPDINKIIVEGFVSRNNKFEFSMVKFQDYYFELNTGALKGDFIEKAGLFNPSEVANVGDISLGEQSTTYTERKKEISAQKWIEHGGFSADVPEVPASLRHFYDPTRSQSDRYLTDQVNSKLFKWAQSFMKNPKTDGVEWAIGENGNFGVLEHVYTWEHGKKYIMAALLQPDIAKRNELMAKAWRSLGETLHMIADNGCPAHVRNDGHPSLPLPIFSYFGNPDPYEEIMAVSSMAAYDGGAIDEDLKKSFRKSKRVHEIAHELAVFTNTNFFTNETISGTDWKGNEVKPIANPDHVYDSPKLSASAYKKDYYYYRTIAGADVKMCTDMTFFKGYAVYRTDPYIDQACVESQAKVLIPAIKEAGIHTMKLFIPALQVEITKIEEDGSITGKIIHKTDEEYPKTISYNGPVNIKKTRIDIINTFMAYDGKFEGRIKTEKAETLHAEIEFGGVTVYSKDFEIEANEEKQETEELVGEDEAAWHLVEIKDINRTKELEAKNKSYKNTYKYTLNYSRGNIHESQTYIGKTDTWYDPPRLNGEGLDIQCQWSAPPQIIREGDKVEMNVSISAPRNNLSSLSMGGQISVRGLLYREGESDAEAVIGFSGIKNKSATLSCNSKTRFQAANDVFYTEPFNEFQMGDFRINKLVIKVTGGMSVGSGTEYIYERKAND